MSVGTVGCLDNGSSPSVCQCFLYTVFLVQSVSRLELSASIMAVCSQCFLYIHSVSVGTVCHKCASVAHRYSEKSEKLVTTLLLSLALAVRYYSFN